jgi:hypothetical protein
MRSSVRFDKPKKKMREVSKVRKFMLMGALVAIVIAALSVPALAQNGIDDERDAFKQAFRAAFKEQADENWSFEDDFLNHFRHDFADYYGFDRDDYRGDNNNRWDDGEQRWDDWRDDRRDDRRDDERNNNDQEPAVSQNFQQQAQSGDVKQSFNVSNTGDNSNQCAGVQGVANTGNAQNQVGVIQYGSEADDFSFEDVGSTITVSPSNSTLCEQRVDQAASASG